CRLQRLYAMRNAGVGATSDAGTISSEPVSAGTPWPAAARPALRLLKHQPQGTRGIRLGFTGRGALRWFKHGTVLRKMNFSSPIQPRANGHLSILVGELRRLLANQRFTPDRHRHRDVRGALRIRTIVLTRKSPELLSLLVIQMPGHELHGRRV